MSIYSLFQNSLYLHVCCLVIDGRWSNDTLPSFPFNIYTKFTFLVWNHTCFRSVRTQHWRRRCRVISWFSVHQAQWKHLGSVEICPNKLFNTGFFLYWIMILLLLFLDIDFFWNYWSQPSLKPVRRPLLMTQTSSQATPALM